MDNIHKLIKRMNIVSLVGRARMEYCTLFPTSFTQDNETVMNYPPEKSGFVRSFALSLFPSFFSWGVTFSLNRAFVNCQQVSARNCFE